MNEITFPLQPIRTLVIASILALLLAVLVFVIAVLPAEYHTDPTGLGERLGLMTLSEPQVKSKPQIDQSSSVGYQSDQVTITIPAKGELEYKFHLTESGKLSYEWRTDGAALHSDFHGEPEGDQTGYYESYAVGEVSAMSGLITVPYAGSHGWYWKNETAQPIEITLITSGAYRLIGIR